MRRLFFLFVVFIPLFAEGQDEDLSYINLRASKLYSEGAYLAAHREYKKALKLNLKGRDKDLLDFHLLDSNLRAYSQRYSIDKSEVNKTKEKLIDLLAKIKKQNFKKENKDLLEFYIYKSLVDFYSNPHYYNYREREQFSNKAFSFLEKKTITKETKNLYIDLVLKLSKTPSNYFYGNQMDRVLSKNILQNALKLASSKDHKAIISILLAVRISTERRNPEDYVEESFEEALSLSKNTKFYDEALFKYAKWLITINPNKLKRALNLLEKIPNNSSFYKEAQNHIKDITKEVLSIYIGNQFKPKSEIKFQLNTKNIPNIEFNLYNFDPSYDIQFSKSERYKINSWLKDPNSLKDNKKIYSFNFKNENHKSHLELKKDLFIDKKLQIGSYLLEAKSKNIIKKALIIVSDVNLTVNKIENNYTLFFSDAVTGKGIENADITIFEIFKSRIFKKEIEQKKKTSLKTDKNGLAHFLNKKTSEGFIIAQKNNRVAILKENHYFYRKGHKDFTHYKIYTYTDRPTYRPEDTVKVKTIARIKKENKYITPKKGTLIKYTIKTPRYEVFKKGILTLDSFGSADFEIKLNKNIPLGKYGIEFSSLSRNIGSSPLFQLEEYKLPEYEVTINTTKNKTYKLGDTIEAKINAKYYFGGNVSKAKVEVVIKKEPFYHHFVPSRKYPWLFKKNYYKPYYHNKREIIKRETLKTNSKGETFISFKTNYEKEKNYSFIIEARVTDSSRREIISKKTIHVTSSPFFAYPKTPHRIYKPNDKVEITINTIDANDNKVEAKGRVIITKKENKEKNEKEKTVLEKNLTSNKEGKAIFNFYPKDTGYYEINWISKENTKNEVKGKGTFFVIKESSSYIGYRTNGVEIILDKESFKEGNVAPIIIQTNQSNRYVLLIIEGEEIIKTELVHVKGTSKLVNLNITKEFIPNVFISAYMVSSYDFYGDSKNIIVPPEKHFINLTLTPNKKTYKPGEKGYFNLKAKNYKGEAVKGEVGLTLFDKSVLYFNKSFCSDIQKFFYGELRYKLSNLYSSINKRPFIFIKDHKEEEKKRKEKKNNIERSISYKRRWVKEKVALAFSSKFSNNTKVSDRKTILGKNKDESFNNVVVRNNFSATALWLPSIKINEKGEANNIEVTYPDSLTSWVSIARFQSHQSDFGETKAITKTNKPLTIRLQSPRFFITKDKSVVISGIVNNNSNKELKISSKIELKGGVKLLSPKKVEFTLLKNSEKRIDWKVDIVKKGDLEIKLYAVSKDYSDALKKNFKIYTHGIKKLNSISAKLKNNSSKASITLEKNRLNTKLKVLLTPSLASYILDTLPYLIKYPNTCIEQTLDRFLPALYLNHILEISGLSKVNKNNKQDLKKIKELSLNKIYNSQNSDGGFGWFKGMQSEKYMTAYVVWGLSLAKNLDEKINEEVLKKAFKYLSSNLNNKPNYIDFNLNAFMLYALSFNKSSLYLSNVKREIENLWENKDYLNPYAKALFALTCNNFEMKEKAKILVRNLENSIICSNSPNTSILKNFSSRKSKDSLNTCYLNSGKRFWYHWYNNKIEATSFNLIALLKIDPNNKFINPISNWLIINKKANKWNNTKDTAISVLALSEYLKTSKELKSNLEYEVIVNKKTLGKFKVTEDEIFSDKKVLEVPKDIIKDGKNEITINRLKGEGPLYYSLMANYFSTENPIKEEGVNIFAKREFYKLTPKKTIGGTYAFKETLLKDKDKINSGDRIKVVITLETKNDYKYLYIKDLKGAGFEATRLKSGSAVFIRQLKKTKIGTRDPKRFTRAKRFVYQELRDKEISNFIATLPQGIWELSYQIRAETPGYFHILPLEASLMYVNDIKANSNEIRLLIEEQLEE